MASSSDKSAKKRGFQAAANVEEIIENAIKKAKDKETYESMIEDNEQENIEIKGEYDPYKMYAGETGTEYFERILDQETDAQVYFEYMKFIKEIPHFETRDLKLIKEEVKLNLRIDDIEKRISFLDLDFKCPDTNQTPILDALSAKLGYSLNILAPPTRVCLLCDRPLNNKYPGRKTLTALFTLCGPKLASKLVLACRNCPSARKLDNNLFGIKQDITYLPHKFGNNIRGFKFYPKQFRVKVIGATSESFFKRDVCSGYWEEFSHGWLSAETKTEAYNMTFKGTENVASILRYFQMNPNQGGHFDKNDKRARSEEEDNEDEGKDEHEDDNMDDDEVQNENENIEKVSRMHEMKRRKLSEALRVWCVMEELEDRNLLDKLENGELFGPKGEDEERISFKESLDDLMVRVDIWRRDELYPHQECTEDCRKRGCDKIHVADGLWKNSYPICMFDNTSSAPKDIRDFLPQDCTNSPVYGKAFCQQHCILIESLNIPTKLRDFISYCKADSYAFNSDEKKKVKAKVTEIAKLFKKQKVKGTSSAESQGLTMMLRNKELMKKENFQMVNTEEDCRKNIGEPTKLRPRSRGILAFVTGGGIIRSWDSLYRSEGPVQVALLMIKYLMKILKDVNPDLWKKYYLSYDNMCHVDGLKLLREALALEEPYPTIWQDVNKVIDDLHIANHKPACEISYNPDKVREDFPDANLMVCEQTFTWLGRFKKVLNATPKVHYHFLVHRLISTRNRYTEHCYRENRRPLLPSAKFKKKE